MMRAFVSTVAAALAVCALAPESAEAIPAFARKYRQSCTTCHAPFPRLKPFGDEFAAAGFRMPDPTQEPARATLDTGDPLLKLVRDLPLAVRLDGFATWNEQGAAKTDAQFPWVFKVLSGGPISEKISYYLYFILEEGGIQGLEDAYVQFSRPFGLPVQLIAGQFQVCDPLAKRELRLSRFDYQVFKTKVGLSSVNLTYDRGLAASWTFPGKIHAIFQLVNGAGIGEAGDLGTFDRDREKNLSLRLARDLGKHVRIGAFGYWGREQAAEDRLNRTYYLGSDLAIDLGERIQLQAHYLERRDDDPYFAGVSAPEWKTRGGFGELTYLPQGPNGRWALTALYNKVSSDDPAARFESASLTVNRLLARNVRLAFEVGRELEHDDGRISLGIVTAF